MARVLVAGASGYLGSHVVAELKRRGHHVRALARSATRLPQRAAVADERFEAEVTRPETLAGACDGMDLLFSSVGITRQRDGVTYRDVDYQGNVNLLDVALRARVRKLVYVSIFAAAELQELAIVRAHEDFVARLRDSGMPHAVLRPTGYFSDLETLLQMARRGRVWLVGDGSARMNPIAGEDLAAVAADAFDGEASDVPAGGPEVLTMRQMAETAFAVLGRAPRVSSLPAGLLRGAIALARPFKRQLADLIAFQLTVLTRDLVAPVRGTITLREHFRRCQG